MNTGTGLKILICDDDPMVLECLQDALESGRSPFGSELVVRACGGISEALATVPVFAPDLVLMDLYICESRFAGIEALERLKREAPGLIRIAITAHGASLREAELRRIRDCGLNGLIDKLRGTRGILKHAHAIWLGNPWFEPHLLSHLQRLPARDKAWPKPLSAREREIVILRAQGLSGPAIAKRLGIEVPSVYTPLKRIQEKLGFNQPTQLYVYCLEHGMFPQPTGQKRPQ